MSEWRYTASSGEVVRTDGVLIAREVPEAFGKLVEAAPALVEALTWAMDRISRVCPHHAVEGDAALYEFAAAYAAIARARP